MGYEYADGEYVDVGEDDTALSSRALEALAQPEQFYASRADEIMALQYDRDEDALREQQYEREAGLA